MGLDTVELVMAFEDAFGIAIPDEEAAKMRTPRMVLEHVSARLPVVPGEGCLTQRTFYAVRRGLRAAGVRDAALRPRTLLRTFCDRASWPALWSRVRAEAGEPAWPEAVPWPGWLFGSGPATLAELTVRIVMAGRPAPGEPWTREQLEVVLSFVIHDSTGVPQFTLDDDFVRDMKLD